MKIPIHQGYVEVTTSKVKGKALNLTVFERGEFVSQQSTIPLTRDEAIDLVAAIAAGLLHEGRQE